MNSFRLLQLLLVVHLAGLTLMGGTTAVNYVIFKKLSKAMVGNIDEITYYFKKIFALSGLLLFGIILLISSGVGLLVITHAYGQLWFQIKMGVIVLIVANGFLFGARQEVKIKQILAAPNGQMHQQLRKPATNLRIFYAIQLFLFLTIVILAVTRLG